SILQLKKITQTTPTYNFLISTLERGETWKGELQFRHKNNEPMYLDATVKPINLKNQPTRYIATFTEINHQKKLIDSLKQRAHQQGLIAILGQISLNNIPISDLLEQTLAVVCGSFNVSAGFILEISVNGEKALVRTAYNTSSIKPEKTVLNIEESNILGYTLHSERPIVCESYNDEVRFKISDPIIKEGHNSIICALIGEKKYPFGIISLLSDTPRNLNIDDIHFLQPVCNILAEAINRKNMEKALRYEQELSRKYLDVAKIVFIVIDKAEKIILANRHAASVLGYSQEDLAGVNFFDRFLSDEIKENEKNEFHKLINKKNRDATSTNTGGNITPILNKNLQTRYIKWKHTALYDEDGDVNSVLSAGEDITEILAQEKEQKQLEKKLNQAQKMEAVGMLAGGIAHDFNNILVSILGFSDLAIENINDKDSKLHDYLSQIKNSGIKARDIIAQMQSINLQDETPNKAIALPSLLKGTLKMLRSALPSSIDMKLNIHNDIPAVHVNASKFNQMVMHLLTNARNSLNGKGSIFIDLTLVSFSKNTCSACNKKIDNEYVVFSIKDSGPGFTNINVNDLFELSNATTSSGLAQISKLVHENNGHIIISETPSNNPASKNETNIQILFEIAHKSDNEKQKKHDDKIDPSTVHGKHIMIVDDENSVAAYMGELFNGIGFNTHVFCDSMEALETFKNKPDDYDLVITDQTMPVLTGDLLAEKISKLKPDLPIIICSGHSDIITKLESENPSSLCFLKKPVDSAELIHTVMSLLSNR
ncbi:hypothetical protein MNBD_GAMMA08-2856, partial [hydrothermal vent metagenome]